MEQQNKPTNPAYHLSEVFDINDFTSGQVNVLDQGTAAGKTTLALNLFQQLPPSAKKLYVCDTTINRDKMLECANTTKIDEVWIDAIKHRKVELRNYEESRNKGSKYIPTDQEFVEVMFESVNEQIAITTYEKLGIILLEFPDLFHYLDMVVLDEVHNLVEYMQWEKNKIRARNKYISEERLNAILRIESGKYNLLKCISQANIYPSLYIIALSATPTQFNNYMNNLGTEINKVETDANLVQFKFEQEIIYNNLQQTILKLDLSPDKAVVFLTTITEMNKLQKYIEQFTNHKAICLWSVNANQPMDNVQLSAREYLIKEEKIPEDIDILILNRAYETGINIKDEYLQYMIVHQTREDLITQMLGRNRRDGKIAYILEKNDNGKKQYNGIIVPDKFVNVPLYTKDKDELCEALNLQRQGHMYKWKGLKPILLKDNVYSIEEGRKNNKRYSIIKQNISL